MTKIKFKKYIKETQRERFENLIIDRYRRGYMNDDTLYSSTRDFWKKVYESKMEK